MQSKSCQKWQVLWHEKAVAELQTFDLAVAKQIVEKVAHYLVHSPHTLGKPLSGHYKNLYRYRHGDYRAVYHLDYEACHLNVLAVGHIPKQHEAPVFYLCLLAYKWEEKNSYIAGYARFFPSHF